MHESVGHLFFTGFLTKLFAKLNQLNLLATLSWYYDYPHFIEIQ